MDTTTAIEDGRGGNQREASTGHSYRYRRAHLRSAGYTWKEDHDEADGRGVKVVSIILISNTPL